GVHGTAAPVPQAGGGHARPDAVGNDEQADRAQHGNVAGIPAEPDRQRRPEAFRRQRQARTLRQGGTMDKRIAVVTGGTGGLGTAICSSLARAGRSVIAVDLGGNDGRVEAFGREVDGLDVSFAALDVSDFDACAAFVADTVRERGSLDILVNAAGITRDVTLRKMDREQWQQVIDVNL